MNEAYALVLIVSIMALATLTNLRISYVLTKKKWGLSDDAVFFLGAGTSLVTLVISFVIGYTLCGYGPIFGLAGVLLSVPFVGFAWIFVVGANKAIERILAGLMKKVG